MDCRSDVRLYHDEAILGTHYDTALRYGSAISAPQVDAYAFARGGALGRRDDGKVGLVWLVVATVMDSRHCTIVEVRVECGRRGWKEGLVVGYDTARAPKDMIRIAN